MAHDLRHRLHIRAMLKSFRGHGMAQAIRRYAPRDARRFSGLMPGMAYAAHRASLPVDDPRTALFLVFLSPRPQQGQDVVPDGDDPTVIPRALGSVGHPHIARRQIHIRPCKPKKLAGADTRPGRHA